MKVNAVPFLFLPGFVLAGYLTGRWSGVGWALVVWCAAVAIGTVAHVMRHVFKVPHDDEKHGGDVTSSELAQPKA